MLETYNDDDDDDGDDDDFDGDDDDNDDNDDEFYSQCALLIVFWIVHYTHTHTKHILETYSGNDDNLKAPL